MLEAVAVVGSGDELLWIRDEMVLLRELLSGALAEPFLGKVHHIFIPQYRFCFGWLFFRDDGFWRGHQLLCGRRLLVVSAQTLPDSDQLRFDGFDV